MFNGLFFEFLSPFTVGGHNFFISNPFLMIFSVLDAPRGGFQVFLDTRNNKTFSWLIYSNTVVASNVQVNWFMRFVMEFFIPYPLASILFGSVYNWEQ
jgi:hypothetical protein